MLTRRALCQLAAAAVLPLPALGAEEDSLRCVMTGDWCDVYSQGKWIYGCRLDEGTMRLLEVGHE